MLGCDTKRVSFASERHFYFIYPWLWVHWVNMVNIVLIKKYCEKIKYSTREVRKLMGKWFFNSCFSDEFAAAIFFLFSLAGEINKLLSFRQSSTIEFINCIWVFRPEKQHSQCLFVYVSMNLWCCWHFMIYIEKLFYRCSIWTLPCILIIPYSSRRYSAEKANVHQVVCKV